MCLDLPDTMPLTDAELCTVLGNLLDNAVKACASQQAKTRRIRIASEIRGGTFFLKIENTCDPLSLQENGCPPFAKNDSQRHGIGLPSVRKILKKYGGTLDLSAGEKSFLAGIALDLTEAGSEKGCP